MKDTSTPPSASCIFCKIISKEIPSEIIRETDDVISIVDLQPNNIGHSLVMPKAHFENIYELPDELLGAVFQEVKRIAVAVKKATGADGIDVHINNEKAAGQVIFHSHIHIIPRFFEDGFDHFPIKGYEYAGQIRETGEKIRKSLEDII